MAITIEILLMIFLLIVLFWLLCLIVAQAAGSPTVYSSQKAIIDALKLADLKSGEMIVDLGCGNARSLIVAAEKFGAIGVGVERSPFCFLNAGLRVFLSGNRKNIKILYGDFQKAEKYLKKADVVYLYLLNSALTKIENWFFKSIDKNARVVSLAFSFPNHIPKKISETETLGKETKVRLY